MVGVPRSRGCTNCKRKKKGCDLVHPTCGQCAKLNLQCTYRQREWTFVNEQIGAHEFRPAVEYTEQAAIVLQHRNFSRTALEVQVVDQFWRAYVPEDGPNTSYIGGIVQAPWKRAVQAICLQDRWVTIALQACAFTIIGRIQNSRGYVQYGRQLYGRALRETNNAIRDPKRAQSDGTLASCKLLGMYESFRAEGDGRLSTQGSDWQRHVEGTCRIVQFRGPEMAATQHGHDLYADAKISATNAGITQKKPPDFFDGEAWSTVPWRNHPKTLRDELFEIMAFLPDVLQQQELLSAAVLNAADHESVSQILEDGVSVLEQCLSISHKLHTWEQKTLALAREARSEASTTTKSTLYQISKSHGFAFFHLATHFWTANLLLSGPTSLTHKKLLHLLDTTGSSTGLPKISSIPSRLSSPAPYASSIAHSASHFFGDEAGLWGSSIASLPLGAALHYYAATGELRNPEIGMIKSALGSSPQASMASGFLRSMASSATLEGGDPKNPVEHERMARGWYHSHTGKTAG